MIEKTEWKGRYIGFWHIHPLRLKGTSPTEGIEPRLADMRNAADLGQLVTIVFQPDGFDVYDLSPLAARGHEDLSRADPIRYRSPDWKPHFAPRLEIAQSSNSARPGRVAAAESAPEMRLIRTES